MSKRSLLLLVVWNVLLSGALIWSFTRSKAAPTAEAVLPASNDTLVRAAAVPRDTAGLKSGRIAFFFMDSLRSQYDLVKESTDRVMKAGQSMDVDLKSRYRTIAGKMQALEEKDQRYTTMAEKEQDSKEYAQLQQTLQQLQAEQDRKQQDFDAMQMKALKEISIELKAYLEEYNKTAGFDYIIAVQDDGQIWVGNKGLDITSDIVNGLNARHHAKKAAAAPAKK